MKSILITICGRGGSKGIPGKNIKPIAGKPLISYTINTAIKFARDKNVHIGISSDDDQIIKTAALFGVSTKYKRPEYMASDSAGKLEVIKDLLIHEENILKNAFDYIIDLDITSPLRTKEDLEEALKILEKDEKALNLFSVNRAARNPYFNMVEQNPDTGYYQLCKEGQFLTRQSAPIVYELNASFYIFKRSFFNKEVIKAINSYSLIYEMPHICFDLDHIIDFEFMEFLLSNNKLTFRL